MFELTKTDGSYSNQPITLVTFNGNEGTMPRAGLIADGVGDLFGTASAGGANLGGTVFEITKTVTGFAGAPATLVSFNSSDGYGPYAGLIADTAGDFFGTTSQGGATSHGGATGSGTVFEVSYADDRPSFIQRRSTPWPIIAGRIIQTRPIKGCGGGRACTETGSADENWTTYSMAQEVRWLDERKFAIGEWDGTLTIFDLPSTPNSGPRITSAAVSPAFSGVEMIANVTPDFFVSSIDGNSIGIWEKNTIHQCTGLPFSRARFYEKAGTRE